MRLTDTNLVYAKPSKITITSENGETLQEFNTHCRDEHQTDMYNKLREHEDLEDKLGLPLKNLFNYDGKVFVCWEIENDENGDIFFDGDSFYGHYNQERFLNLIKRLIQAYIQTWGKKE